MLPRPLSPELLSHRSASTSEHGKAPEFPLPANAPFEPHRCTFADTSAPRTGSRRIATICLVTRHDTATGSGPNRPPSEYPTTSDTPGHRPNDPATRPPRQGQARRLHRAPTRRTGAPRPLGSALANVSLWTPDGQAAKRGPGTRAAGMICHHQVRWNGSITGQIKCGDANCAFVQLRRLSGHTLWPPP